VREAQELLSRRSLDEELPEAVRELTLRVFGAELDASAVVDRILRDVRQDGDAAVRRYNESLDGVRGGASGVLLELSQDEIRQAYSEVEPSLVDALKLAAAHIRGFHERQLAHSIRSFEEDGLGQIVRPLRRVGLYVPGTKVVYPSTVLMTALPARVAGVPELVMATPPAEDGSVAALKLVAADIAGVGRIFRAGGVQGVAAMAYGTDTVPRVDKVCGPGNIFVTLAKKKLYGEVGIDGIFGPSETLVIGDESADPALIAADLLAGAEHDELATAVLITNSQLLAENVARAMDSEIGSLERASVARMSLNARGGIAVVDSTEEAIDLANRFAPEHLCLHVADANSALIRVINAGCVFVGAHSAESIGDYTAGPSHVMPTGGSAVYASPLGVQDFIKVTSVVRLNQATVDLVGPAAAAVARAEGLTGHARAVESRLRERL
jgi:histidinol dehydrogenase